MYNTKPQPNNQAREAMQNIFRAHPKLMTEALNLCEKLEQEMHDRMVQENRARVDENIKNGRFEAY